MTAPPSGLQANTEAGFLEIAWPDHPTWQYPFRYLRENCECALCVHEITGERLLDPATIPDDIHIASMKLTGKYAVKIVWSDGHDTGLFTWERLRNLCKCSNCVE